MRPQRRSKNGTPEQPAAKKAAASAAIAFAPLPIERESHASAPLTTEEFAEAVSRMHPRQVQEISDFMGEPVWQQQPDQPEPAA